MQQGLADPVEVNRRRFRPICMRWLLDQEDPDLVDGGRAPRNQPDPASVQGLKVELIRIFLRNALKVGAAAWLSRWPRRGCSHSLAGVAELSIQAPLSNG